MRFAQTVLVRKLANPREIKYINNYMNDIKNQTIEKPEEPEIAKPEKKEKYRMRLSDKIIAAFLAVFFICIFYIVLDANKYRATVRIVPGEGMVGINSSTASLDFGDLSLPNILTRLMRPSGFTSFMKTNARKNLIVFIRLSRNEF